MESLGSVSVICSDKTGTLTQNRMCIQQIYADGVLLDGRDLDLANPAQRLLLKTAVLASDATDVDGVAIGDPTEIALVQLADVFGVEEVSYREQHPRLGEIAFDSDRKLMSTLHDVDGVPTLMTKGAHRRAAVPLHPSAHRAGNPSSHRGGSAGHSRGEHGSLGKRPAGAGLRLPGTGRAPSAHFGG